MITRFAPSPSGHMHLGHVFAAKIAQDLARKSNGQCLLRIDDIDHTRSRPEFHHAIFEDLEWLGFSWDGVPRLQSDHLDQYQDALDHLIAQRVAYPCFCTRREIQKEVKSLASAPHGAPKFHYPGTCRSLEIEEAFDRIEKGEVPAWRLHADRAADRVGALTAHDQLHGDIEIKASHLDDVVLGRKDIGSSYHLSVVVDDAAQGITLVSRGEDLLDSTRYHRLLQALLGLPVPLWHHHQLIRDSSGKRLATRDKAHSIQQYRKDGLSPADVLALLPDSF